MMERPLLLKDYLLDDMSSCSSNGFASFSRRKCCAVGFLGESHELESRRSPPKSAIQSVISAVRKIPISLLWKRKQEQKVIGRRSNSVRHENEGSQPSYRSRDSFTTSEGKRDSWWESDFTATDRWSAEAQTAPFNLNICEIAPPSHPANDAVSAESSTNEGSTASATSSESKWLNEAKEEFSPVSVLDCSSDDDDEEFSSPFQHKHAEIPGTKKKHMNRIMKVDPVNLVAKFLLRPDSTHKFPTSINQTIAFSSESDFRAFEMVHQMKEKDIISPSYENVFKLRAEKLLSHFFHERIACEDRFGFFRFDDGRNGEIDEVEKKWKCRMWDEEEHGVGAVLENFFFDFIVDEFVMEMSTNLQ